MLRRGFPDGSTVKKLPANVGDAGSIPGSGRSPGEGNGNLLQYSCLGNPMDRGTWRATVHGVTNEYYSQPSNWKQCLPKGQSVSEMLYIYSVVHYTQ